MKLIRIMMLIGRVPSKVIPKHCCYFHGYKKIFRLASSVAAATLKYIMSIQLQLVETSSSGAPESYCVPQHFP